VNCKASLPAQPVLIEDLNYMTTWLDRLRVALILSPALLLLHVWILACSNGYLVEKLGMVTSLGMAVVSSIVEAYIIVLVATTAIKMWQGK
jgi:ABC-type transporter Mla maintaining outer membrane lipid asymmetry permease subunit MlaE